MKPTVKDAMERNPVRISDGRVATLVYWPLAAHRRKGRQARVRLVSGTYLSFPCEHLSRLEEA